MCSALVSRHGFKNDVNFMCSALVSPHGLKNDECYMCTVLVSRHGFQNDIYFMCSALVSLLDWKIFSLSLANRLLLGRTVFIGSDRVCLPTSSTPLALVNLLLPVPPIRRLCSHFQFQSQSDSILREDNPTQAGCIGHVWQFASRINEMKYPTTKRDSPLPNDFKFFQKMEPVDIIFMKN